MFGFDDLEVGLKIMHLSNTRSLKSLAELFVILSLCQFIFLLATTLAI